MQIEIGKGSGGGVVNDGHPFNIWHDIFETLEQFTTNCRLKMYEPRDVAARMRERRYESLALGISDLREYDWDRFSRLLESFDDGCRSTDDQFGLQFHQLACKF